MVNNTTFTMFGVMFGSASANETGPEPLSAEYVVLISILAGTCSLITVVGNTVVILSFLVNKTLRNFSNYLILSLALSDLTIGLFSMNVFTTYNVNNSWILGGVMCKAWLTVDYTASNASVMNLLVICVDRYLAITKPVKYKKMCSPRKAAIAIAAVWTLSFLLWGPAIIFWDIYLGGSSVPEQQCFIPFINDSALITLLTIIGAFYFPALLMCALYQRVISKIRDRRKLSMFGNTSKYKSKTIDANHEKISSSLLRPAKDFADFKGPKISDFGRSLTNALYLESDLITSKKPSVQNKLQVECHYNMVERTNSTSGRYSRQQSTESANGSFSAFSRFSKRSSTRYTQRYVRERRVTGMLKFILICFITLWLPYSCIVVVTSVCPRKCAVPTWVWNLGYWLCYLNSTVNPFCYGFCNENFRRTFKAIVTTRWWTAESRKRLRSGRHLKVCDPVECQGSRALTDARSKRFRSRMTSS